VAGPPLSILTPVYNGAGHLAECVDSVLAQTRGDWEYIIVDNCSTDGTSEIAREFAAKDDRIRYERYDEFVDQIESHNRAFRAMSPESTYCKVVQADDWLYPECLDCMMALAESSPNVGIVSAYRLAGDTVDLVGLPYWKSVAPGREILRQSLLGGPYLTGTPTSLLLRSDLVRERQPFYDPTFRHADTEAAYWALTRSDFGVVHQVLTYSRPRSTGETPVSLRVNSYSPENLRMLLRYGQDTLSRIEYRRRLREELRKYVWWHVKQSLKPSRRRDSAFHAYQRQAAHELLADASGDREVREAVAVIRLLLRPSFVRRSDSRFPAPTTDATPTSKGTSRRSAPS